MLAEKDPIATALFQKYKEVRMPTLPVGNADMDALINFLTSQDRAANENKTEAAEPKTGALTK